MPKRPTGEGLRIGVTSDRPRHAAALMVGALFLLGLQDAVVKLTSVDLSLWQFQMLRSALNLAFLFTATHILWRASAPRPKRLWTVALRSLLMVCTMVFYFGAVPFLNLAEIAAGLYVFPLFVAVLSALLLRERVGPRRIAAILVGFGGTLLILKPTAAAFQPVALMPVAAALFYAGTILTTRRLCREESPVTLSLGVAITFLCVGIVGVSVFTFAGNTAMARAWPYLFTGWHDIGIAIVALIAVCSVINLVSNIALARAYQSAEASWLVPFDYSYIVFAAFWGYVFWAHIPDKTTILGIIMIAGAGGFVAWRERQAAKGYTKER